MSESGLSIVPSEGQGQTLYALLPQTDVDHSPTVRKATSLGVGETPRTRRLRLWQRPDSPDQLTEPFDVPTSFIFTPQAIVQALSRELSIPAQRLEQKEPVPLIDSILTAPDQTVAMELSSLLLERYIQRVQDLE